jgi:hypothetical protein
MNKKVFVKIRNYHNQRIQNGKRYDYYIVISFFI